MTREQFLDCLEKELDFVFGKDFAYFDFVHAKTKEKAHVEELMLSSRDGKENAVKNNEEESEKDGGNKNKREEEENASSKMNKKANNNNNRKNPTKVNTNAMAFIDLCTSMKEPEMSALIEKFVKAFDGAPFQVKGETSRAKVEFALNQRVPFAAQQKKKEDDSNEGKASVPMQSNAPTSSSAIFKDADFLNFQKTFDANGGRRVVSRSALRTGLAQPRDETGKDNVKISALVNFVAKKRHSEQAILEKERKEEERKRLAKIAKKKKKKNAAGGGGNVPGPSSKAAGAAAVKNKKSGTVRGGQANPPPEEKKKTKKKKSGTTRTTTAASTTMPAPKPPGIVLQKNKSGGKKEKKPNSTAPSNNNNNNASSKKTIPVPKPKPK